MIFHAWPFAFQLRHRESFMPKKHVPLHPTLAGHSTIPVQPDSEVHHDITSPDVVHANDRMKLAAKPNDGQPLSHRDRAKTGRKG